MRTELKNRVLESLGVKIRTSADAIMAANMRDLAAYRVNDAAMLDRLKVDKAKVASMAKAVEDAMQLRDPVGKLLYEYTHPQGMRIENRTVPFGRILIIYESRPDVTIEAAVTAFKAGNRILLKGGKEARETNLVLTDLWKQALSAHQLDPARVTYLDIPREQTQRMIRENTHKADLIIPRGGDALIGFVKTHANIPVIVSGRGNNFLYIDETADFDMAARLVLNGKQRISVCNALDKVIFSAKMSRLDERIKALVAMLQDNRIEVIGDEKIKQLAPEVELRTDDGILEEEFLAPRIMLLTSSGLGQAIEMINTYSGGHSATIVTESAVAAHAFMEEVDCAAVYHNASTRFTDGGQFGFGAEMAISTQKLHFRGPIGIEQLVTNKWFVYGTGQTRE